MSTHQICGGVLSMRSQFETLLSSLKLYCQVWDFIVRVHDPPDIRREQKTRNEFAIDFAGAAIAYRALKTEFSPSIRHAASPPV
jgi:hypothetical protein